MRTGVFAIGVLVCMAASALAQNAPDQRQDREMSMMTTPWMVMSDGVLFGTLNHQSGPRGGDEFRATNWAMVMGVRRAGAGRLTLTAMLSLDPATATPRGYRELFQSGEAYHGQPIVDRQHPHDAVMGATAAWRLPIGTASGLTIGGGPIGEPTLGPVAFMHRPSAAENPAAPLAHHTLDSTHISMGVVSAGVDHGAWTVEGSIFNGREPDDQRWDVMDPGALDSWAARVWFTPSQTWEFQFSHGSLTDPEELEPGDIQRTTASGSWFRTRPQGFSAVTLAAGRNGTDHGNFRAVLGELTDRRGPRSVYTRLEILETELTEGSWLTAATVGAVREIGAWSGWETGVGADVTMYRVPDELRELYGNHPLSFHVFVRVRPPEGHMGRMWGRM